MAKEYIFDKRAFLMQITITGIFTFVIFLLCIYGIFASSYASLCALIALIAGYTTWNNFVSVSNPQKIEITNDFICFSAYRKEHKYLYEDIKNFKIREFPSAGKIYLRINECNILKGRYWIHTAQFENGKELFKTLLDMEYELHPDSLKARARRVNTQYAENKKKLEESCR